MTEASHRSTTESYLLVLRYWTALLPPACLALSVVSARTARSADEALGEAFCLAPVFLVAFGFALVGLVLGVRDRLHSLLVLSSAVIPMWLLILGASAAIGWPSRGEPSIVLVFVAANAAWVSWWLHFWPRRVARRARDVEGDGTDGTSGA